jgi:multisubunit Na+/H+ antiporter MnhB subunit
MKTATSGMTLIVKTVARLLVAMIFVFGLYIVAHGHLTPGGGFGGGVVIALGLLSVLLAFGREKALGWVKPGALQTAEASALVLYLAVGLAGLALAGAFLRNILPLGRLHDLASAGFLPVLNIIIGVKVGLSLFLVVLALTAFDPDEGDDE